MILYFAKRVSMKKLIWLRVICVIAIVGFGIWWWSRAGRPGRMKEGMIERYAPRVTISSMTVTAIKEDTVQLNAGVNINNLSPIDLHIKRFSYQVYIQDEKIGDDLY